MGNVLGELGISMPRSNLRVVARVLAGRARQALVGRRFRPRSEPASARELQRVDTLCGLSLALWLLDPMLGAALQAEHLPLALRSGDRARAAMALMLEAPIVAIKGWPARARTRRALDAALSLADDLDESVAPPALRGLISALVALLEGRWGDSRALVEEAAAHPEPPSSSVTARCAPTCKRSIS